MSEDEERAAGSDPWGGQNPHPTHHPDCTEEMHCRGAYEAKCKRCCWAQEWLRRCAMGYFLPVPEQS